MISSKHRFHGYNSLKQVYKLGSTNRGPNYSIKSLVNPKRKSYRLAVVVSRKVHKSAVARNRMRRRLYEGVRAIEGSITQPYDIVINVFNDQILTEDNKNFEKQLTKQLKQSKIIK